MRRNCNLELRLLPRNISSDSWNINNPKMEEVIDESPQDKPKQITIFYNGTVCVSHVTEIQARSIIQLAIQHDEKLNRSKQLAGSTEPNTPNLQSPNVSTPSTLQMRRSLQMFLQKRKHRAQAASPY
ncbi:hypothetical protein ACFE04_016124 [Oxalis oulophora]